MLRGLGLTASSWLIYKNDCEAGTSGKEGIVYELPAGAVISDISQIDADTLAYRKFMKEGQEKANAEGSCSPVFYNTKIGDWFERYVRSDISPVKYITLSKPTGLGHGYRLRMPTPRLVRS